MGGEKKRKKLLGIREIRVWFIKKQKGKAAEGSSFHCFVSVIVITTAHTTTITTPKGLFLI